jgi:DNA-binding transcriptional MerR regulator
MRVYTEAAVNQVALIDLLQLAGFTLGEIRSIVNPDGAFSSDWRNRALEKIDELNKRLAQIEFAKTILEHTITCPHDSLNECPVFRQGVADHAGTLSMNEQHDMAAG